MKKNISRRVMSAVLGAVLLVSSSVPVFASGVGYSDVTLQVETGEEPSIVSVKVPTEIPLKMDKQGIVTVPQDLKITNLSDSTDVELTGLSVTGKDSWVVKDYLEDLSSKAEGTKELSMSFRGDGTTSTGDVSLTEDSWVVNRSSELLLNVSAKLPKQGSEYKEKGSIAQVNYTFAVKDEPTDPVEQFTVTYIAGENGSVNESSRLFESGAYITFPDTTPSEGYVFDKWVDSNTELGVTGSTTVNANMTVKALFKPEPVESFTVTYTSGGNGTVNEDSRVFDKGSKLTFPTTTPSEGYVFDKWIDGSTGSDVSVSTVVNSEMTVKALFVPKPVESFTVNYISDGNGTVGESSRVFKDGSKLAFPSTTPNTGYTFVKWVNSVTNEEVTTSTIVCGNMSVKALFKINEVNLTDYYTFTDDPDTGGWTVSLNTEFRNALNQTNPVTYKDWNSDEPLPALPNTYQGKPVTNMSEMFSDCDLLTSLDLSGFDTSNVTNMFKMFYNCCSLITLNLSSFNTKNVQSMNHMFRNCESLITLDLSNFNTPKLENMFHMFNNCKSLTTLNVSNFNTTNVTNMFQLFSECESLTTLDLSSFDTTNLIYMTGMFRNCVSLTTCYARTQADCNLLNQTSSKPINVNFIVKP